MWTFVHTQVFPTAPTNLSSAFADILFQSTHPREVRHFPDSIVHHAIMFQSTHPRGVRRLPYNEQFSQLGFNPRTREGCDLLQDLLTCELLIVSIHAPARGATVLLLLNLCHFLFQSTHPRGVRLISVHLGLLFISVSIHAPARGAT